VTDRLLVHDIPRGISAEFDGIRVLPVGGTAGSLAAAAADVP
jgi:hypothetical protein